MALDKEYFDSIHIDVVKKKYYNANKVNAVFEDIRRQAEELTEENEQMRVQLETLNGKKFEIGDAILTAQAVYRELTDKAKLRAAAIVEDAEKQSRQMLKEAEEQKEYAVRKVESCCSKLKAQHMAGIEAINSEWQDFLCGLYPENEVKSKNPVPPKSKGHASSASGKAAAASNEAPEKKVQDSAGSDITSADIDEKISAIAKELFSDN